ncbi:MAG: esterase/lipase/thioesterase family protein, partial [Gemmatimonadetes bacterium]|nr:esterase/lipase/thioesterase family protein [Gemmatimonadota bacterium]
MQLTRARGRLVGHASLLGSAALASCIVARPARTAAHPLAEGLGVQPVSYASASGSTIKAWIVAGRKGAGALLLLHGVGANRTSMVARARFLNRAGYTILLPDLQAHGESEGEHITFGTLESRDARASLDFLRRSAPD